MKFVRFVLLVGSLLLLPSMGAADSPWQPARIVTIKTTTNSRTAAWIVNTPIEDEEHVCYITVQYKDKVVKGSYVLGKAQAEPPPEWVKHVPVRLQLVGDTMFLKAVTGEEYRLHVESTKSGPMMDPLTPEELAAAKTAAAHDEPQSNSMIGFDQPEPSAKSAPASAEPAPPPSPPPPPPEPTTGSVSVSSTPFLADLYVDGENMGYTPAKLKLAPGKHTFRCEKQGYKPWTKEITLTVGSELTLDATLDHK
jgi:hypothetical protein